MSELLAMLVVNSLAALPIALLALLLERVAWRAGPACVAMLWWSVLLRLALPAGFAQRFAPELLPAALTAPLTAPLPDLSAGSATLLVVLWLGVALVLFAGGWLRAARAARLLAREAKAPAPMLAAQLRRLVARLGLRSSPPLRIHPDLTSPLVVGILRPRIFVPAALQSAPAAVRQAALAHELAHVRRRDPLRSFVVAALRAGFWFHPLAWIAARRLQELREFACDRVATQLDGGDARPYAQALASFAMAGPAHPRPGLAWITGHALLTRRIERLLRPRMRGAGLGLASTLCCLLTAVCCTPPCVAPPALLDLPGCLQLRYAVLQMLADEQQAATVIEPALHSDSR